MGTHAQAAICKSQTPRQLLGSHPALVVSLPAVGTHVHQTKLSSPTQLILLDFPAAFVAWARAASFNAPQTISRQASHLHCRGIDLKKTCIQLCTAVYISKTCDIQHDDFAARWSNFLHTAVCRPSKTVVKLRAVLEAFARPFTNLVGVKWTCEQLDERRNFKNNFSASNHYSKTTRKIKAIKRVKKSQAVNRML